MVKSNFREIENLAKLKKIMGARGAVRLYVKKLAPNDNSKNQPYLGGDFEALNIIPNKGVVVNPKNKGGKRDNYKAQLDMYWVDADNRLCPAPKAQLILYPKYPEVRLSGFLTGCEFAPARQMTSRAPKRRMFLGITDDGKIIGHVTGPENPIYREIEAIKDLEPAGVFLKIPLTKAEADTRDKLIAALKKIHLAGWIRSSRLLADGSIVPYKAPNGGGYTLEAMLGIRPNGYSEPDYHGWEVKQHGVAVLEKPHSGSPITLFTPEPTAGIYKEKGVEYFIRKFGYPDTHGRPDRMNFGGIHCCGIVAPKTGLIMDLIGYDKKKKKITNPEGGITLLSAKGEPAAIWLYADLMKHWNRKHAQAAYVPSLKKLGERPQYRYGNIVELGRGTDFLKFLEALSNGVVYYDPGIKMENTSKLPIIKRRSQFRIEPKKLSGLYHKMEIVDVLHD